MAGTEIDQYERENLLQEQAEHDTFTAERYQQLVRHLPRTAHVVLDIGCATGRGGVEIAAVRPDIELWGIDVVQQRLDALPDVYVKRVRGLSTAIPLDDQMVDVIVAGEFLEHLRPHDVDSTLCEFQRVLKIGGRLLLTTPNPDSLRVRFTDTSVYGPGHLTQHHAKILRHRVMMHGFRTVHVWGTGKASRTIGTHIPWLALYGSYLLSADKT